MTTAASKVLTRRPPVIVAILALVAVLAFLGVNRLVTRFREQEKALARHLYERGLQAQRAGQPEQAIADFRAALGYASDNFDYQLGLARALRDTGRTAEAETYLITLWERAPQEGAVNLALGRLFAREQLFDKTIQYYHNAIYGFWPSDSDVRRQQTQFELIAYLLQHKAYPQAQAELIVMASALPGDPGSRLRVAQLFAQAQDYERALDQFQELLRTDHLNQAALEGAGQAAFQLGLYRTAEGYLQSAARGHIQDPRTSQLLQTATLILQADPYAPHLSGADRRQRLNSAFQSAGQRLQDCARSQGIDLNSSAPSAGLPALEAQWLQASSKLIQSRSSRQVPTLDPAMDQVMDLVFEIEQQTQTVCEASEGLDQALLLLSQDRGGVER